MTFDRADEIIQLLGTMLEELHHENAEPERLSAIMRQLEAIESELPESTGVAA